MDESFYVTLPSNSSAAYYPDNEASSFTTKLAKPLQLTGSWVCGLAEIHYPTTWSRFYVKNAWIVSTTKSDIECPFFVREGFYANGKELIESINRLSAKKECSFEISYEERAKKVHFRLSSNAKEVKLSTSLARILGFSNPVITRDLTNDSVPTLESNFATIFCYGDHVETSLVGDSLVPLLRAIQVDWTKPYGSTVYVIFNNVYYVPVSKNYIDTIEIGLYTELGKKIPFDFGYSLVKLHIKKGRMNRSECMKPYRCDGIAIKRYYLNQAGDGFPVYAGTPYYQRGHGIGSIFSGLFKAATPLLKTAAKSLGKKALRVGAQVANDVLEGQNLKTAGKRRILEAGTSTLKSLTNPIKRKKSVVGGKKRLKGRRKRPSRAKDIFD